MDVGHHVIIIPEARHAGTLDSSPVKGTKLPDCIAIAYFQSGCLIGVLFVLRLFSQRAELKNPVIATDTGMAGYDDMRSYPGAIPDLDVFSYKGIGTNGEARPKACGGVNNCGRMNPVFLHWFVLRK